MDVARPGAGDGAAVSRTADPRGAGGGRPLFIWDGACGFCRFWMLRWRARVGRRVDFAPYQRVAGRFPDVPLEAFRRSARLVLSDGSQLSGAASVLRLMAFADAWGWRLPWWAYRHLPPLRPVLELGYRVVARHRDAAGAVTRALWGRRPRPPSYAVGAWVLLRALALLYLIAFGSLLPQIAGLVGSRGILPISNFLDVARRALGPLAALWRLPTLAWLGGSGAFLELLAAAGMAAGLLLFLNRVPRLAAAAAWALYLSLTVAGQAFLSYQWDALLIEAGLLALLLAVSLPRSRGRFLAAAAPPAAAMWLFWWLLFRLNFESGLVKLASGDPSWRHLTALAYHYETQPLPNPVSWYAFQLPLGVQRACTLGALIIELGAPALLLLPRRVRFAGASALIALQTAILLTGNFGIFNLLTIALALSVFDDAAWRAGLRRLRAGRALLRRFRPGRSPRRVPGLAVVVLLYIVLGGAEVVQILDVHIVPGPVQALETAVAPFQVVNGYGLFAVMTTTRPEIILEGRTGDGPWRAYRFRDQPGDLGVMPPQVAPFMPRLDWQMWFAALTAQRTLGPRPRYDRWLVLLVVRLLQGDPAVTALLDPSTPFRRRPPDEIRALLYDYRFTSPAQRRRTGDWWSRRLLGVYIPPLAIRDGRLTTVH